MRAKAHLYRLAYPLLVLAVRLFRPWIRGVRVVARQGGAILLVRHTYGKPGWSLPGGLIGKAEDPVAGGIRETREETGILLEDARLVPGSPFPHVGRMRGELWIVTGSAQGAALATDGIEIGDARWFPEAAIPADLHSETRVILERAGIRTRR